MGAGPSETGADPGASPPISRVDPGAAGRSGWLEKHQALIVAHNDKAHRHVHVIVNRVDMETGKAAHVGRSKLLLSKWAEEYERRQGRIRCDKRVKNNAERRRGEWVRDRESLPSGNSAG